MNWDNQQNNPNSIWDGFENVETSSDRNGYLPAGINGIATMVSLKTITSKMSGQPVFVAEVEIDGSRFDWIAKLPRVAGNPTMAEQMYLRNVKSLVCALNPSADPRSFGPQLMGHLTGPEQPATGLQVRVRTEEVKMKNGSPFTKVYWSPAPAQAPAPQAPEEIPF